MKLDEVRLKAKSLIRRAGLQNVPVPALVGVAMLCLLLVAGALWRFWPSASGEATSQSFEVESEPQASNEEQSADSKIKVDVEGAVASPGLYELEADARAGDAIEAAGGLTADAANASVNLAQVLTDGQQLYVPTTQEVQEQTSTGSAQQQSGSTGSATATGDASQGKININTATADELQELSGIGPTLAQRIVDYREANGAFASIEDLKNVSGIGDTRFAAIKDSICV